MVYRRRRIGAWRRRDGGPDKFHRCQGQDHRDEERDEKDSAALAQPYDT